MALGRPKCTIASQSKYRGNAANTLAALLYSQLGALLNGMVYELSSKISKISSNVSFTLHFQMFSLNTGHRSMPKKSQMNAKELSDLPTTYHSLAKLETTATFTSPNQHLKEPMKDTPTLSRLLNFIRPRVRIIGTSY